jgi:hypothetical protein
VTFEEVRTLIAKRQAHFDGLEERKQKLPPVDYFDDAEDFKLGLLDNCPPAINPDPSLLPPEGREGAAHEGIFVEPEQWALSLSDPYRTIVLYFDPSRHRSDASRKKLVQDAAKLHPGRQFRLQPLRKEELASFSISPYAHGEHQFKELGYVNEIDARKFGIGKKHGSPARVSANLAVARTNSLLWKVMLKEQYKGLSLPIEGLKDEVEEELDELAAQILGRRTRKKDPVITEYSKRRRSVPIVLHGGLYLGNSDVSDQHIYASVDATPQTTGKGGRSETARQILFGIRWENGKRQLEFELKNADWLFGDGKDSSKKATDNVGGAIVTWFSQVIIAQRRAAWRSKAATQWPIVMKELKRERQLYGKIAGIKKLSWRAESNKTLKDPKADLKSNHRAKDVILRMSLEDRILAALHGSAIDLPACGEYDFFNNGYHLLIIANWVGSLKRTGEATITKWIARCLEMGQDWIERDQEGNHLSGQFVGDTWAKLFRAARQLRPTYTVLPAPLGRIARLQLEKDTRPLKVKYEWVTDKTIDQSWTSQHRRNILTINGPMLCFPRDQRQFWVEKSAIIRELAGFQVPALKRKR